MSFFDRWQLKTMPLIKMERYTLQQRVEIVKIHYKNAWKCNWFSPKLLTEMLQKVLQNAVKRAHAYIHRDITDRVDKPAWSLSAQTRERVFSFYVKMNFAHFTSMIWRSVILEQAKRILKVQKNWNLNLFITINLI